MGKPGRRLSTEQTRLLIALVGALANSGDALMLSSVVARLGISEQDGRAAIDSLVDLGGMSPAFAVAELEEAFDITIPTACIVPANFNSAEAMWEMITRLQEEG